MHQLPDCCAKRPHVDFERIVQTTVGKAKRKVSFRGTDLNKKDKGTGECLRPYFWCLETGP